MIALYYIGGPWDLTKRMLPSEPKHVITIKEYLPSTTMMNVGEGLAPPPVDEVPSRDHRYITRPIGRDVYVAVHEDVRP